MFTSALSAQEPLKTNSAIVIHQVPSRDLMGDIVTTTFNNKIFTTFAIKIFICIFANGKTP
jgi:hypothetical protein